jgi:PPM family protein phosphatase
VSALALKSAVRSDAGPVRPNNEDAVFASPRMAAVADGVGGRAAGEVASRAVIDMLAHMEKCRLSGPLAPALEQAIASGNERIGFIAACRPQMAGMSTTLTAVALGDGYAIASIGDSRAYLYRDGALTQLTRDDSFVQLLIDSGELDPRHARSHPQRSLVLQALDGGPDRRPTLTTQPARAGDRLLLCSDGLSDMVDEEALAAALAITSRERCADRLVELALGAGGRDNVSVVVADVVAADEAVAAWA